MQIYEKVKKNAIEHKQKIAIKDTDGTITYAALISLVDKISQWIDENNIHVLGFLPDNSIAMAAVYIAGSKSRITLIPINSQLKKNQIEIILKNYEIDGLIINKVSENYESEIKIIAVNDLKNIKLNNGILRKNCNKDFEFIISLTSGSTGDPKPIVFYESTKINRSEQAKNLYGIDSNDVIYCASPIYHSLGQRLLFVSLLNGCTLILQSFFSPEAWENDIKNNNVTFTIPVSSQINQVIDILTSDKFQSKLRLLVSSSAAISPSIKSRLFNNKKFEFREMYGASEVGTVTELKVKDRFFQINSVGKALKNIDIKIKNQGEIQGPNKIGEILINSYLSTKKYYKRQDLTDENYENGYFKTGDLGYIDENGFLYYSGRKKELINCGGSNIYPRDIESALMDLPYIKEVAVIPNCHEIYGEIPVAVIVLRDNYEVTTNTIRRDLMGKIAVYQVPWKYFFLNKLPYGTTGKIDKNKLINELSSRN